MNVKHLAPILLAVAMLGLPGCAPAMTKFQVVDGVSGQPVAAVQVNLTKPRHGYGWSPIMADDETKAVGKTGADGRIAVPHGWDDIVEFGKPGYKFTKVHIHGRAATFFRDGIFEPYDELGHQSVPPAGILMVQLQPGLTGEQRWAQEALNFYTQALAAFIAHDPRMLRMSDEEFKAELSKSSARFQAVFGPCPSAFLDLWLDALHAAQQKPGVGPVSRPFRPASVPSTAPDAGGMNRPQAPAHVP